METLQKQNKLAVLIDADNASPSIIEGLIAEISKYGIASVKRIYGDWTNPNLKSWKDVLLEFSIQPIQQFSYTTGKNATDSSMIIDAMDLLYTENLEGFCIVSSDSDFTRIAARIRENGLIVFGFGEKKTPKAFVSACDKFIYTEILRKQENEKNVPKKLSELRSDKKLVNLLKEAVFECEDDSGWAYLGSVGRYISNKVPDFDSRNYGFFKLGQLIRAIKLFQILEKSEHNSPNKLVYIRYESKKRH